MSSSIFNSICSRVERCRREVLDAVLELAVEIAREGREGRRIGTLFTLGHADAVLSHSRPLILDPDERKPAPADEGAARADGDLDEAGERRCLR